MGYFKHSVHTSNAHRFRGCVLLVVVWGPSQRLRPTWLLLQLLVWLLCGAVLVLPAWLLVPGIGDAAGVEVCAYAVEEQWVLQSSPANHDAVTPCLMQQAEC